MHIVLLKQLISHLNKSRADSKLEMFSLLPLRDCCHQSCIVHAEILQAVCTLANPCVKWDPLYRYPLFQLIALKFISNNILIRFDEKFRYIFTKLFWEENKQVSKRCEVIMRNQEKSSPLMKNKCCFIKITKINKLKPELLSYVPYFPDLALQYRCWKIKIFFPNFLEFISKVQHLVANSAIEAQYKKSKIICFRQNKNKNDQFSYIL